MHLIMHYELPPDHKFDVTYYNPTTKEKIINDVRIFRVRGVAGGDRINYTGVVSSSIASLQLIKIPLHSVVVIPRRTSARSRLAVVCPRVLAHRAHTELSVCASASARIGSESAQT